MRNRQAGVVKPIPLFVALVVILAGVGAIGFKAIFEAAKTRAESRRAEKASAKELVEAAQRMAEGKTISGMPNFPDTPQGRVNRHVYELVLSEQQRQQDLEARLQKIGWDWVMSPESLRSKKNVEECLRRLQLARGVVKAYQDDLQSSWRKLNADMKREADASAEAKRVYDNFQESAKARGGGLYYANQIAIKLGENHDALEESLRFLLARTGKYEVDDEGQILFNDSVPDRDLEAYNKLIERIDDSMKAVEKLDQERLANAQRRIGQAKEFLK